MEKNTKKESNKPSLTKLDINNETYNFPGPDSDGSGPSTTIIGGIS